MELTEKQLKAIDKIQGRVDPKTPKELQQGFERGVRQVLSVPKDKIEEYEKPYGKTQPTK